MISSDLESASPWGAELAREPSRALDSIAVVTLTPTCEHCQQPFQPRSSNSGGLPQRFCSSTCRKASNNSKRRSQRLTDVGLNSNENFEHLNRSTTPHCETLLQLTNNSPTTHEALAPKDDDRFDWTHDGTAMLEEQRQVAIYIGERGHLVIRQRADWPTERDDTVILISPQNVIEFVDKLTDVAGIPSLGRGA
jgi:hypothetical protein